MTRTTLLALASRVEAATGADRELDIAILTLPEIGYRDVHGDGMMYDRGNEGYFYTDDLALHQLPSPTASLDAAMSLVPIGHRFAIWPRDNDRTCVQMWHSDRRYCGFGLDVPEATASTPALALTAASLRAIAGSIPND